MENTRDKSSESHNRRYQKDYTKLEAIFDAAVKRSRRKKIIYYASDRLYSENSRREIAQNSYKAVAWAEPLEEKDIHTEIIDLANKAGLVQMAPSEKDEKELLAYLMNSEHSEAPEHLTSKEVIKALHEIKQQQNEEPALQEEIETKTLQEDQEVVPVAETVQVTEPEAPSPSNELDFLERYYKTKQEVLGKLESSQPAQENSAENINSTIEEEEPVMSSPEDAIEATVQLEPKDEKSEVPVSETQIEDTVEESSPVEEKEADEAIELRTLLETLAAFESEDTETEPETQEVPSQEVLDLFFQESTEEVHTEESSPPPEEEIPVPEADEEPETEEEILSLLPEAESEEAAEPDEITVEEVTESEEVAETAEPEELLTAPVSEEVSKPVEAIPEEKEVKTVPLESVQFIEEEPVVVKPAPVPEPTPVQKESTAQKAPVDRDLILTDAQTYENLQKDLSASTVSMITSLAVLAIYVLLAYPYFLGFDYIALILTVVGIFLAWDMRSKSLIFMCIIMLFTLIACMMIWVNQTRVLIDYIHYFWFFIIPLCMGVSFAYFNSKRALDNFKKDKDLSTLTLTPEPVVQNTVKRPEKIDLKTIINDLSEDESSLDYERELKADSSDTTYASSQSTDTENKTVDITIDETPNWSFYQVTENPDLLNYEASLEDYMPILEDNANETASVKPNDHDTKNIPQLSDFISVDQFGLSEEELNESIKTQDTGPVVFNSIRQVTSEYFEVEENNEE